MENIALITGATSGIGKATALLLAENGYNLILTGRTEEKLQEVQQEIEQGHGTKVLPLVFDVRDREAMTKAIEQLPDEWKAIDVLINNAGLALDRSLIYENDPADWDVMIDTNIKGLLYITHAILPLMIERQKGYIINLGSIAGKEAYKMGAVYNATKFAVDALTKAIRIDCLEHSIRVGSICPGAVETNFSNVRFKGDDIKANATYEGYDPLAPEDIADAIWYMVSRPPHVTINDMLIMPTAQANSVHLYKKDS